MSKIEDVNKKIERAVVDGYKKIENGVVEGYRKIEEGAVSAYKKVEEKCIETLFAGEGESAAQARERMMYEAGRKER